MNLFPKNKKKLSKNGSKKRKILGHRPEKILKFFAIAEAVASLSKIPTGQVGAIILDKHLNLLSSGWNGFPRGVDDINPDRLVSGQKRFWTCHAEGNCVAQAARTGARLNNSILLVTTLFPCSNCAALVIQAGVKHIFTTKSPKGTRWFDEAKHAKQMFKEAKIKIHYVQRNINPDTSVSTWFLEKSLKPSRNLV